MTNALCFILDIKNDFDIVMIVITVQFEFGTENDYFSSGKALFAYKPVCKLDLRDF